MQRESSIEATCLAAGVAGHPGQGAQALQPRANQSPGQHGQVEADRSGTHQAAPEPGGRRQRTQRAARDHQEEVEVGEHYHPLAIREGHPLPEGEAAAQPQCPAPELPPATHGDRGEIPAQHLRDGRVGVSGETVIRRERDPHPRPLRHAVRRLPTATQATPPEKHARKAP